MKTNYTTTTIETPKTVIAPWFVDCSGELVNEVRTEERSADGKWLKQHVKLNVAVKVHSASDVALAAKFDCDSDMLFA